MGLLDFNILQNLSLLQRFSIKMEGNQGRAILNDLKDGNRRFYEGRCRHGHQDALRRQETSEKGQHPDVTIITCSDSRVPVEILFDQGIGDLFVIRVAGNICAADEIASIEYGVDHLETPVLIVLGHSDCGAVTAAVEGAEVHGTISELIAKITPAVEQARQKMPGLSDQDIIPCAIEENVWNAIDNLLGGSEAIRHRFNGGHLHIEAAIYDIDSGRVEWLGLPEKK